MEKENLYTTLGNDGFFEITIDKSTFLGYAKRVTNEKDAVDFVNLIKKKHSDARHNVYAYVLKDTNTTRYSDDGEPAGTAGMPVLDVIRKKGLTDVVIVVTRYFGGILLGTGGLVRAYTQAAADAVNCAGIARYDNYTEIRIPCDYSEYGKISFELERYTKKIIDTDFGEKVELHFLLLSQEYEALVKKITELFGGRVHIEKIKECFFCPELGL